MKRMFQNTRLQLIVLASSLLITTMILGLSAYLTDNDSFSSSFKVKELDSDDDLEITIVGTELSGETVYRGQVLNLSPTVHNDGDFNVHLFAEVTTDGSVTFDGYEFLDPESWKPVIDFEGTELGNVYYFGSSGSLSVVPPGGKAALFENLVVNDDASYEDDHTLSITVYAIQSAGYAGKSPYEVLGDAR